MPGVTKHIYERDLQDINKMWNTQLKNISGVLPCNYCDLDIINALKKYYPHEWDSVVYKKQYYDKKDKYIARHKGAKRYHMPEPEALIKRNNQYKLLMKKEYREKYAETFCVGRYENQKALLWKKREPKIRRVDDKINAAISRTQKVTPDFLDALIGLYNRKNTSQKDRMYIMTELKKYYNPVVIDFFFKCNDTEINRQLRENAFYHLQSFNYQPRLRKQKYMEIHTKNKKRKDYLRKVYPYETYEIPFNPEELEYRINEGREQHIKTYKYFISHSSTDASTVKKLIDYENKQNILVFCDWINDADYLKRHLVCEATLNVIEWRLEQSEEVIFVRSEKSEDSIWCQYELNYFYELGKPIYYIEKEDIENGIFRFEPYDKNRFYNEHYKELALIEGLKES